MRLSLRTAWDREESRWAAEVRAALDRRAIRFDLTQTNPTRAGLVHDDAVWAALDSSEARTYEPDPLGLPAARRAVAEHYGDVDPERVWLCASTSEAYAQLLTLLADPGDQIAVPRPGYPLLDVLADTVGVVRVEYPVRYDGRWHLDASGLAEVVGSSDRLRALVAVSPNNPTGNVLDAANRSLLGSLADAHDAAEIVDEVFADYPLRGDPEARPIRTARAHASTARLSFLVSGLSKVAALPQLKLSWIVVGGTDERAATEALQRARVLADAFLSVATPVQLALPVLLAAAEPMQARIRRRLHDNLAALRDAATQRPWAPLHVEAGWTALVRVPQIDGLDDEGWALHLLSRGILTTPGFLFDLPPSPPRLAISLLGEPDATREGIAALDRAILERL